MNNPLLLAHNFYLAYGQNFEQDFNDCMASGVVVSSRDLFLMAKPMELAPGSLNARPQQAWLVLMAVGDIKELVTYMPYKLPFVAFYRRKGKSGIRLRRTEQFINRARREVLWVE